ncbi:MAG: hypothetical protein A3E80_06765 [Chlamydiae bacterium RIFCSPHIGHO2_12_FULL_49_9]|nr:MAG: hypothetical protein A3E80_06765 [Chlamydiae bacterium RIFCSPHIGHO2_12_FULL_49_9]
MTVGELKFLSLSLAEPEQRTQPASTIRFRLDFQNKTIFPIRFLVLTDAEQPIPDKVDAFFRQASIAIDLTKPPRPEYPCIKQKSYSLLIYDEIIQAVIRVGNFTLQANQTLQICLEMGEFRIKTISNQGS